ncbi:MAG: D-alanyl-D-alanine carboxypeptidase family protein [Rhodospirillaceae bacterium]|nr:D-alanyl-D-alanine carboxypeptidase family protein [Rhodospirillaceae bacterium]
MTDRHSLLHCHRFLQRAFLAASLFLAALIGTGPVAAQSTIDVAAAEAIVVDFDTGAVLYEKNPDLLVHPASMSKLMTLYMLFDALKNGQLSLDDSFPVSEAAWALDEGSTMFVGIGERLKVEDLIRGIVVQSGNDACFVIAEGLAGSEAAFVEQMNKKAAEIGLSNSHFVNSHGLEHPEHQMTVRDIATLSARLIRDFPEYYHYFAELTFVHNGIEQGNRNPLLYRNMGVDGLKTGHLTVSGYGLAASALRNGRRVVVVAHGMESMQARADEVAKLIEWAYREFDNYKLAAAGDVLENAPVWLGEAETVPMVLGADLVVTLPRGKRETLEARAVLANAVPAPIAAGQPIGMLIVTMPGMAPLERPLLAGADVAELGMFGRVMAAIRSLLFSDETEAVGA